MLDSSPEDEDFPGRLLHQAALWDNTELLEDLLEGGQHSFINSRDSWGRTPLHAAAICESSRCLMILLNAGADPNLQCGPRGENKTPLHLCAEHGYTSNATVLLQQGASMLTRDINGMTPSDLADKAGHTECITLLKDAAELQLKTLAKFKLPNKRLKLLGGLPMARTRFGIPEKKCIPLTTRSDLF